MARVTLNMLNLVVGDMAATLDFYRRLGVEVPDVEPEWESHHRSAHFGAMDLDFDSTTFTPKWNEGWPGGTGVVIGFAVEGRDEVDALYADLTGAGHPGQQPPFDAFWGARYAVVSDPDGNAVGIMSPVDPERRGPSPDPAG
jgi:uncharacterized glyoxalase superfamily protein PhnB